MSAEKIVDQSADAAEALSVDYALFVILAAALVGIYFLVMSILKSSDNSEVLRKMNNGKL
eukprot:CAMPEP_0173174390 /NCGR_PEP_ID=MMETSP1141-20130122/3329_1 /TAXON_ID=483371 /ORGANISM="non described non described, Strain CCMP2298" /LENGTH=59 /DNA_ID=CAMNT_0014096515 /DNA_START=257 /DNA_END=436 /DNA_ORIENTATION=+